MGNKVEESFCRHSHREMLVAQTMSSRYNIFFKMKNKTKRLQMYKIKIKIQMLSLYSLFLMLSIYCYISIVCKLFFSFLVT